MLDTKILKPTDKKIKIKQALILCHGYGGDGQDISILATQWQKHLYDTIFYCPDAPYRCKLNPSGFEWFDLSSEQENEIVENSLAAEEKLNLFIDKVIFENNLKDENVSLVGFSQGTMISLQAALKRKNKLKSVIGFSGKIISSEHLRIQIKSRPEILLIHGDQDNVVPITNHLESLNFFNSINYKIKSKVIKNCDHRIDIQGSKLALDFLKKN